MSLYAVKVADLVNYEITKFDSDFNMESSYIVSKTECTCPQGSKPTCRHRKMLPQFLITKRVNTQWFLDYETGSWFQHHFGLDEPLVVEAGPASHEPPEPVVSVPSAPATFVRRV